MYVRTRRKNTKTRRAAGARAQGDASDDMDM
jgi:hypothetical protein